nr:AAA family ATPase [Candidatus Dependentiae bacterium]
MISYRTIDAYGLWNKFEERKFDLKYIIPRRQLDEFVKRIKYESIEVIIGPRQSGKTTLLFLLIDYLLKIKTEKKYICYINLDTIQDYKIFSNPQLFIENIRAGCNPKKKIFVFIDEIQRIQNSG